MGKLDAQVERPFVQRDIFETELAGKPRMPQVLRRYYHVPYCERGYTR